MAGAGAAMLHEAFDFSFHKPSNVLLFTTLLALAVRLALTAGAVPMESRLRRVAATAWRTYLPAIATAAAALGLIVAAWAQERSVYPYNSVGAKSLAQAEAALMAHPAMAETHLALVARMPSTAPAGLRGDQLRAAVWLDTNDPYAGDLYAKSLLMAGREPDALRQVTLSVYHAPRLDAHYYLAPGLIPWLLPQEQRAIIDGFERAVTAGFGGAVAALATFYSDLGRYREVADLYARAAKTEGDDLQRLDYLVKAGHSYALAGDAASSQKILREAQRIDPTDPKPYIELVQSVFGPARDLAAAKNVTEEGIRDGAEPYALEVALASAAEGAGDQEAAAKALEQALHYEPTFSVTMHLGDLYLSRGRYERAVLTLQRAIELNPNSAEAFFALGRAKEAGYDYFGAGKAYARATALAPGTDSYRSTYLEFQRRTAEATKENSGRSSGLVADPPAVMGEGDTARGATATPVPNAIPVLGQ
jgi:tetratricopeptide (TPR) repeat protein